MNIDMNPEACLTTIVVSILIVMAVLILGGCHITEETRRQAIKAGLVETNSLTPTQYQSTTSWVKP